MRCPTCHRAGPGERTSGGALRRPARLRDADALAWKKHRMRCRNPACPKKSWVLEDHRIAAKNCLLTTRAAKWATVQVGGGRTVSEVAAELACDWHTVNDAVTTYGNGPAGGRPQTAEQDQRHRARRDLVRQAQGQQPRRLRHHGGRRGEPPDHRHPAHPQLRRRGRLDRPPARGLEGADPLRRPRHVGHLCRGLLGHLAQGPPGGRPLPCHLAWPTAASMPSAGGCRPNRPGTGADETIPSIGPAGCC